MIKNNIIIVMLSAITNIACYCTPSDSDPETTTNPSEFDFHYTPDVGPDEYSCPGDVGCPCSIQDDCSLTPGSLYCVPEFNVCSSTCATDVDCPTNVAGMACVTGWCGIPCELMSPYQCGLLDPSSICVESVDGRKMCGNL